MKQKNYIIFLFPMMVLLTAVIVSAGIISAGDPSQPVKPQASIDDFTGRLEKQITQLMDQYEIPGVALALIVDGEPVWSGAYGYANLEKRTKMTVNAICRTESISKSITAWGVMKLEERGQIDLDTPVQQYLGDWKLPDSKFSENEVTIRRLLSNSAGMPLGTIGEEYPPNSGRPSLRQYLTKEAHLTYEPGSKFLYSNPGFNLLELLVEEVTDRDFAGYMKNEVLLPLGMHHSSFDWNEDWSSKVPLGYDLHGNAVPPYVYPYKASGGLFSTVKDIARFASAGMTGSNRDNPTILDEKSIRTMYTPQVRTSGIFSFVADAYGFGHFIETLPDGKRAVWHGGQGLGWMTHFHVVPETGDGIVIFTNSQRGWPFMAHVLKDWSNWRGFGPVQFARITTLVTGMWIVIILIVLLAIWRAWRIAYGLKTGKRKLSLSLKITSKTRIAEFLTFVIIAFVLLWAITRDYLFISSIFPVGAVWLGWGLLFLSVVLLISAFCVPQHKKD